MFNASIEAFKRALIGKKVAVLGLGVSNLPAIDFLSGCGAVITACDSSPKDKFPPEVIDKLKKACDNCFFGEDYLEHLEGQDIILKSPGINPSLSQIVRAKESGTVITSEMEIFMSLCPCRMIAVTGSDGKTTTTTLIYKILCEEGYRCHVGGNIGTPLLNRLDEIYPDDIVVLELSSFQLMNMSVSPHVAVITNITPNHLDYHRDMSEYVDAKARIFAHQDEKGRLIVNKDNAITASFAGKQKGKVELFSRKYTDCEVCLRDGYLWCKGNKIVAASDIRIKGVHNVENYLAAIAATYDLVDPESIQKVAKSFGGVEHRMEFVRSLDGVSFYNDSIGSSPTRTIAGLTAHEGDIVLIAGGKDKNLDYDELGRVIKDRVRVLVLIGATSDKIEASVRKAFGDSTPLPIVHQETYENAVKGAFALARGIKRDDNSVSVILSPASTSFDMFKNFEHRGNVYKEIVNSLEA
ncbi:MAG: UDP-N-acetylmuramoyl-L-alanine--D-glutamate ligase [Clostridia bacterium]|nr:UDP-N-acetylmuramoyl-L-alanine--D-glutamate ligase [Clostridia bacterium]